MLDRKDEEVTWMLRLDWSLSRLVTQDIKTQPQINRIILVSWVLLVRSCIVKVCSQDLTDNRL